MYVDGSPRLTALDLMYKIILRRPDLPHKRRVKRFACFSGHNTFVNNHTVALSNDRAHAINGLVIHSSLTYVRYLDRLADGCATLLLFTCHLVNSRLKRGGPCV